MWGLSATSSHGNFATLSEGEGRCGNSRKMCWDVGGGRVDVGRGMRGVGKCVRVWGR